MPTPKKPAKKSPPPLPQVRCTERGCKKTFTARKPGQKYGTCDDCRAEKQRLAALHRKGGGRGSGGVSAEDRAIGERERRMTMTIGRINLGSRVALDVRIGWGGRFAGDGEASRVSGVVTALNSLPWGESADVQLDEPAVIGPPDSLPVAWVSTSPGNLSPIPSPGS